MVDIAEQPGRLA